MVVRYPLLEMLSQLGFGIEAMASTIVVIAVILKTQDNAGFIGIKTDESLNNFMEHM